jgi:hypothetical protein
MRACFLGQNVTALGFGVAILQIPPPAEPHLENPAAEPPLENQWRSHPEPEPQHLLPNFKADAVTEKAPRPPEPAPAQPPQAA